MEMKVNEINYRLKSNLKFIHTHTLSKTNKILIATSTFQTDNNKQKNLPNKEHIF